MIIFFIVTDGSNGDKEDDESINVENQLKECTMPRNNSAKRIPSQGSCFWIEGWRAALCTCKTCKEVMLSFIQIKILNSLHL